MTRPILVLMLGSALTACASTPEAAKTSDGMAGAMTQPFRDLNIMREEQAAVLTTAAAAPYAPPSDCSGSLVELQRLDEALGPDIDAPTEKSNPATAFVGEMVVDAVRGATGLPFRGIVRRVTGAAKREKDAKHAVYAGALRRAYLKGFEGGAGCRN